MEGKTVSAARGKLLLSMTLFGTIGVFVRVIGLPSSVIALVRAVVGTAFLWLVLKGKGQKLSLPAIRQNLILLILSGIAMGFNWILLWEAYRYTTQAVGILCYYMAPMFVIAVSPMLLKERLTLKKVLCVGIALVGMTLVSGVLETGVSGSGELTGVLLALGAACLYASIVLMNKKMKPIPAYDQTILQLGSAALIMLPYALFTVDPAELQAPWYAWVLLVVLGVVHTGTAYALYFGAIPHLQAQTAALLSYVDPLLTVLLSALVLGEALGPAGIAGAVLILGAALLGELPEKSKKSESATAS